MRDCLAFAACRCLAFTACHCLSLPVTALLSLPFIVCQSLPLPHRLSLHSSLLFLDLPLPAATALLPLPCFRCLSLTSHRLSLHTSLLLLLFLDLPLPPTASHCPTLTLRRRLPRAMAASLGSMAGGRSWARAAAGPSGRAAAVLQRAVAVLPRAR